MRRLSERVSSSSAFNHTTDHGSVEISFSQRLSIIKLDRFPTDTGRVVRSLSLRRSDSNELNELSAVGITEILFELASSVLSAPNDQRSDGSSIRLFDHTSTV